MNNHDKLQVQNFLNSISPWRQAYGDAVFSYIAVKKNEKFYLLSGRIFLGPNLSGTYPPKQFETKSIAAGFFNITDITNSYEEFITQICEKKCIILDKKELIILVEADLDLDLDAYFNSFHLDHTVTGKRISHLRISGRNNNALLTQPELDWELKAAETPFDSINDLMTEYWLGSNQYGQVSIEVFAHNIVEINTNSELTNDIAQPKIILAANLDKKLCKIGYRIILNGIVSSRGSLGLDDLEWIEDGKACYGSAQVKIPVGAVMHCVAIYAGEAQHQYWLADPKNLPNSRRSLLEESDKDLKVLRDYLFEEIKPRKNSRDFEFGIANLMWLLGFSVVQPGAVQRTTESVDVIATSNNGYVLLIECTIGLLKAESKLATLIARTESMKRRLQNGHSHLKIYPVIVTAMTKDDVKADLKTAVEHKVIVITKEYLYQMLDQTVATTNPDLFVERLINIQSSFNQ
ncbi:hypothetical protein CBP51_01395 [Cellvibrio mixtus]|uniref:Uncharacterized protein n=1 Tax=Cellvibrio mixtus TaxID=39650 RepID=A0A266Q774_9GAMM|nr:hypothetical protein [Cellvibrio mixtus]OZY85734.1 hypothetical protein CBP51_01395 [Cellvibrio mixtus]